MVSKERMRQIVFFSAEVVIIIMSLFNQFRQSIFVLLNVNGFRKLFSLHSILTEADFQRTVHSH